MFESITGLFGDDDPQSGDEQGRQPDGEPESQFEFNADTAMEADAEPAEGNAEESVDDGPDVSELDVRLDDLERELDSTDSSLRAVRDSQQEMAESMEDMNDTVRDLVGLYGRLTAEENPFIDEHDGAGDSQPGGDDRGQAHPDDQSQAHPDDQSQAHPDHQGAARGDDQSQVYGDDRGDHSQQGRVGDEVVSFDDLENESGEEVPDADAGTDDGVAPDHEMGRGSAADQDGGALVSGDPTPLLGSVPDGYAADVLMMEWLAMLMDKSGPAGALRAVNHYENIGWISPAVNERLVDILGGPGLDVFVDPTQPREPTADDHAASHEYIQVLNELKEV